MKTILMKLTLFTLASTLFSAGALAQTPPDNATLAAGLAATNNAVALAQFTANGASIDAASAKLTATNAWVAGGSSVQYARWDAVSGPENLFLNSANPDRSGATRIKNLLPGVAPTDAVNMSQLNSSVSAANAYTDRQIIDVQKGVATSIAMQQSTGPVNAGETAIGAAVGGYGNQTALSLSVTHAVTDGIVLSAAIGVSQGSQNFGYRFGGSWIIR